MLSPGLFIQSTARKVLGWFDIVKDFGADPTGTRDSTVNIQAALDSAVALGGGLVFAPPGLFRTTDTLRISGDSVTFQGCGMSSHFRFLPTVSPATWLEVSNGVNIVHRPVLRDFFAEANFAGAGIVKNGIRLIDCNESLLFNIQLLNFVDAATSSKGLIVKGRQLGIVGPMGITADLPISIEDNPNSAIDIDHFHFHDLYLLGNGVNGSAVTIASGVNLSFVTFDGSQAWVLTNNGLVWNDTTSALSAPMLTLHNVRWEQMPAGAGWLVDIAHNHAVQALTIENCYGGLTGNGFRLRAVQYGRIHGNMYIGPNVALDVNGTVLNTELHNNFFQTGSTINSAGFGGQIVSTMIDNAAGNRSRFGVGTLAPDASSQMDIVSTTKGVLLPRMTTAQRNAIAAPAIGLLIYNTDTNVLNFWNGAWTPV